MIDKILEIVGGLFTAYPLIGLLGLLVIVILCLILFRKTLEEWLKRRLGLYSIPEIQRAVMFADAEISNDEGLKAALDESSEVLTKRVIKNLKELH